jgi:hypothetical protein
LKPRALRVGQRLIIPMSGRIVPRSAWNPRWIHPAARRQRGEPAAHRVRSGETASRISRRYGVGLRALLDYNGLDMDSIIKPGQTLRILVWGRTEIAGSRSRRDGMRRMHEGQGSPGLSFRPRPASLFRHWWRLAVLAFHDGMEYPFADPSAFSSSWTLAGPRL